MSRPTVSGSLLPHALESITRVGPIKLVPVASIARESLDGRRAAEGVGRNEAARGTTNEISIDRGGSCASIRGLVSVGQEKLLGPEP
jgi:hypothetical protein